MLNKLKWPALLIAGAGGYLAYQGWTDTELYKRLDAGGVVVPGVLESGEVKTGRRSRKSYSFEVSYTTEDGKALRRSFDVEKSFVERVVKNDEIVNDEVQVKYDPADPERAIVLGASKDQRGMLPIGGAMAAGGALLAGFLFLRGRPRTAVETDANMA